VDGLQGLHTARAIRNFQRASHMPGDGTISTALRQAMQEWSRRGGQAQPTTQTASDVGTNDLNFVCTPNRDINVNDVVGAKTFLRCNGFSYGGTMAEVPFIDPTFRAAVAAFQAVVGIPANGIVLQETAAAMHAWEGTWANLRPDGSRPEPRSTAWQVDGSWTKEGESEAAGEAAASSASDDVVSPESISLDAAHQLVEDGTTITAFAGDLIVAGDSPLRGAVPAIVSALQGALSAPYCQDFTKLKTVQLRNLASRRGLDARGGRESLAEALALDAQEDVEGRCPALASSANEVACCVREKGCLGLRCYVPIDGLTTTQSAGGRWATVRLATAGGRACDTEFRSSPAGNASTAGLTPDGVILETQLELDSANVLFASATIREALRGDADARHSLSLLLRLSATPSDDTAALPVRSLRVRLTPRGASALITAGSLGSILADVTLHACYDDDGMQCEPGLVIFRDAPLAFPDNCDAADASRYRREDASGAADGGLAVDDVGRLTLGEAEGALRAFGLDGLLSQLRDVILVVDRLHRQDGIVDDGVAFSPDGFEDESLESLELCIGGIRELPIRSKTFLEKRWIVPLGGFVFFQFSARIAGEVGVFIKLRLCIPTLTVTPAAGPYFSVYAVRRGSGLVGVASQSILLVKF
jgi:peptidoglycan hydrolase-like protein with peptidoglycan-binding domain